MTQTLKFEEITSESSFQPLLISKDTPFAQAYFYGEWQAALGRKVRRFVIKDSNEEALCLAQFISYPLIRGRCCLHSPYGPVIKDYSPQTLQLLKDSLKSLAKQENWVFARLDFSPTPKEEDAKTLNKIFQKAPASTYRSPYFQPRTEWVLDLHKTEEDLLKEVDSKNRYGIRFATRNGLTTEVQTSDFMKYFDDFYGLMKETSGRNAFGLHSRDYYKAIFENCQKHENAFLVITRKDQKILVVDLILMFGNTANYLFSGASNEGRRFNASYLAQWTAICQAKSLGCSKYNFGGINAGNVVRKDWEGLSLFKKRFGGQAEVHADFYDIVFQPLWYRLYASRKIAQNLTR